MPDFFARGAEAKLYDSTLLGMPILIKERGKKEYRTERLDEQLRKSRTRNEARVMLRALAAGINVPRIFSVGIFNIHMEKLDGKRLREAKNISPSTWKSTGEMLAEMHGAGITHGDFTPANIVLCKAGVYVIDFGLASMSNELEERAVDVLLMEKNISEKEFTHFIKGYRKCKDWKKVLAKVQEIKKRGRYQIRTEEEKSSDEEDEN